MKALVAKELIRAALILLAIGAGSCGAQAARATVKPLTRSTLWVGFWTLWRDRQIQLDPEGPASVRTCEHCRPFSLRSRASVHAEERGGLTLAVGKTTTHADALILSGPVRVSGHGASELLYSPIRLTARNGTLVIAVNLPLETYVEQVVASESSPMDTIESLKALAIVVRSYALHEQHGHPDYDVCDSTHCQLLNWHGVPERRPAAHQAAIETGGETLWFQNRRALAYFTKDCGGQSAAVHEVWPKAEAEPYLASRPDAYCSRTPNQQWAGTMTRAELTTALARRGLVAPGWQHLSVERRSESGRVSAVRLDDTVLSAEDFRIAVGESLGWNRVQSNWFEVSEHGDTYSFYGRGSGHGVGLCQKGATAMGSQGRTAAEILAQYFPGTYPADEATGAQWTALQGTGFVLETLDPSDARFLSEIARARAEASLRSGLNQAETIVIRTFPSTSAFREATLAPGWMAAFTEGDWIATQPMRILASRNLLLGTLRHEVLHALIERQANAGTPLWIREGLVELWSTAPGPPSSRARNSTRMKLDALEGVLRHARNEDESRAAHRDAALYAQELLDRYGRDQVLGWVRSGIPAEALLRIGQR